MTREADIGPLEMQVLGLLDGRGHLSVNDVKVALEGAGHELAYTTVMTVLVRLHEKGLVQRTKEGRRYLYATSRGAPRATSALVSRLSRALFRNDRVRPILALLDDDKISDDELRELRRAIDERLRGRS